MILTSSPRNLLFASISLISLVLLALNIGFTVTSDISSSLLQDQQLKAPLPETSNFQTVTALHKNLKLMEEKTLFSKDRAPYKEPEIIAQPEVIEPVVTVSATPEPEPEPEIVPNLNLVLIGTYMVNGDLIGLFKDQESQDLKRLKATDQFNQWELKTLSEKAGIFNFNSHERVIVQD